MREDYIRFENFLAGTGNEFIGRGAPQSGITTHILHLKQLKNPVEPPSPRRGSKNCEGSCFSAEGVYGGEIPKLIHNA